LEQSGTEGLIKAVDNYELGRGSSFTSYAGPKIAGEIKHHLRDHTGDVHVPRTMQERTARVAAASARIAARNGRPPRTAELAEEAGINEAEANEALIARAAYCTTSLQATTSDGASLEDTIAARDAGLETADDRLTLSASMRTLPTRERKVLALHFWGDLGQREIASEIGVSQIQVSRLLRRALDGLRLELRGSRSAARRAPRGPAAVPAGADEPQAPLAP
jgi:RNA polymerase sigma-B factor